MTPELTQELKALLCPDGCGKGLPLNTCDDGRSHITPYGSNQVILCTANPAVIKWVEKQLEAAGRDAIIAANEQAKIFSDYDLPIDVSPIAAVPPGNAAASMGQDIQQAIASAEEATVLACMEHLRCKCSPLCDANHPVNHRTTLTTLIKTPGQLARREAEVENLIHLRWLTALGELGFETTGSLGPAGIREMLKDNLADREDEIRRQERETERTFASQGTCVIVNANPPQQDYAYVENKYGTFARFYGPDANALLNIFLGKLARREDEIRRQVLAQVSGTVTDADVETALNERAKKLGELMPCGDPIAYRSPKGSCRLCEIRRQERERK